MDSNNFYKPESVRPLYDKIIPAYQEAFAGDPWYEVSKCPDQLQRCAGGLSALAIGDMCNMCGMCPENPAYDTGELASRFDSLASSRSTAWYLEQNYEGVTLAAVAWVATADVIAEEKYNDVPVMENWINTQLGNEEVMWLDDVFVNKQLKPEGNLRNFGKFVTGLAGILNTETIAYRTVNPRMLAAAERDFGQSVDIYTCNKQVPDRRSFVIINIKS